MPTRWHPVRRGHDAERALDLGRVVKGFGLMFFIAVLLGLRAQYPPSPDANARPAEKKSKTS